MGRFHNPGVDIGAEGFPPTSCDSHDVVDYDAVSLLAASGSAELYYHTKEERQRVFPADHHICAHTLLLVCPQLRGKHSAMRLQNGTEGDAS